MHEWMAYIRQSSGSRLLPTERTWKILSTVWALLLKDECAIKNPPKRGVVGHGNFVASSLNVDAEVVRRYRLMAGGEG